MNVSIRNGIMNDKKDLFELNKKCLPIYYSEFEHFYMLISKEYITIVVEFDKKLIGYLIGKINNVNFHILSIGIDENYRNKGIGSLIIQKLQNDLLKTQNETISLYVHMENEIAIKFYKKNGFHKKEKMRNYYKNSLKANSQDALKMIKNIKI